MNTLKLNYSSLLQGEFKVSDLNFLFTFQVNCPGCFLYGFPVVNKLYSEYKKRISFIGLSTAFEDFELNTENNTKILLKDKSLVGETKKALKEQGFEKYPQHIDFPVAMDAFISKEDFITIKNIETICALNSNYPLWSELEQKQMQKNIKDYLKRSTKISSTFTLNQFKGTPTFVIFDKNYSVLEHWFSHKSIIEIKEIFNKHL